jgi:RHS repeat-associated protein
VDHLNSTRAIVDDNGIVEEIDYLPFGGFLTGGPQPSTTHLFTGHERDTATLASNLDYMHARYFSPNLGRFLSVDPVGGEVGSSQSWNRYSYVRNNPIIRNDPTGLIDGGLVKHEHNTAMGIYFPAVPQKEAAWLAGLGASLTLAAVTSGQSLTLNLLSGALSNMTGGVVTRGLDGDDTTAALDTRSMLVDGGAGALSTGAAENLMGVKAVTTAVDNVVGVGAARVAGNPVSSALAPGITAEIGAILDAAKPVGPNPDAQNPSVNCHAANPVLSAVDLEELEALTVSAH